VVDRLHAELSKALALPDVRSRFTSLGGEPGALSIQQFTDMNRADYERSGKLIREAGIKIDG
jgi:tripartite-type tricarboxylate transporter receptor subunit TctC